MGRLLHTIIFLMGTIHDEGWHFSLQTRWRMLSPLYDVVVAAPMSAWATPPLLVATVALASPLVAIEPLAPVMVMYGSRLTSFQPNNRSNKISPLANHGLLRRSRRLTTIVPSYALASPAPTIDTLQLPCGLWCAMCDVRATVVRLRALWLMPRCPSRSPSPLLHQPPVGCIPLGAQAPFSLVRPTCMSILSPYWSTIAPFLCCVEPFLTFWLSSTTMHDYSPCTPPDVELARLLTLTSSPTRVVRSPCPSWHNLRWGDTHFTTITPVDVCHRRSNVGSSITTEAWQADSVTVADNHCPGLHHIWIHAL